MFGLVRKKKVLDILYKELATYEDFFNEASRSGDVVWKGRSITQYGAIRRAIDRLEEELA